MATLANLLVKVGVDASDVDKQTQSIGQRFQNLGRNMSLTVTPAVLGLGNAAVNAASDLEESVNAIEVVFGDAADTIRRFGETSEDTVGLSTRAFNQLVTPVGAALQNVGFSADDAAEASINLAQRAADMASVFNTDVDDALTAIQAGLRGEADPLEQFGVGLSAAAVEAKAMELGLADAAGELDNNAKAQARLALLMEQTDKIAGDFANTSGSVANQERMAAAEAENMAAAFGQDLIPIKQQLISVARDLLGMFNSLSPSMRQTILTIAAVAAAIGPLILVTGSLTRAVLALVPAFTAVGKAFLILSKILLANPWVLVAAAIIALVIVVIKNWDTITSAISKAWQFVRRITAAVWDAVVEFVKTAARTMVSIFLNFTLPGLLIKHWDSIKRGARIAWNATLDFIKAIPGRIIGFFTGLPGQLFDVGKNLLKSLGRGISSAIGFVTSPMSSAVSAIKNLWPFSPAKEGPLRQFPPELAGENIGLLLAEGLAATEREVVAAAEEIARAAAITQDAAIRSADVSTSMINASRMDTGAAEPPKFDVRVFVGDTEIRDIVRVEISEKFEPETVI